MKNEGLGTTEYSARLAELKKRYRATQIKAAIAATRGEWR